jgi:outer membrane protein OmpA-like peptidoglycan-associated protein
MKKLLAIVVIWALMLGGGAAAYYYLFLNKPADGKVVNGGDKDKDKDKGHGAGKKLKLALDSFSGYCIFRSADFKQKLADQGLDLETVDDGADYKKRLGTVQSGDTPLAAFTIDALINNTNPPGGDPQAAVILAIDETRGADAMIGYPGGTPDIVHLNRADQKIVLVPDSPSETLARVVRSQFSLPLLPRNKKESEGGYLIAAADEDAAYGQFLQAQPFEHKAFVLWEPYVSKALQERPGTRILVDSSKFKGYIVDVLVAQRSWLHDHAAEAKTVVRSYLEVLHAQQQSSAGMAGLVLSDAVDKLNEKLTADEAAKIAQGIWWKNTMENYGCFGILPSDQAKGLQPLAEMIHNITVVLDQTKQDDEAPPGVARPDKLYDDVVLRPLYEQARFQTNESIREEGVVGKLGAGVSWADLQPVGLFQSDPIEFQKNGAEISTFEDWVDGVPTKLLKVADNMRQWPRYYVQIEGNIRANDTPENQQLAQARADLVKKELVKALGKDAQGNDQDYRIRAVGNKPSDRNDVDFVMLQR